MNMAQQRAVALWEIHPKYLKPESYEISFTHNLLLCGLIVLRFGVRQGGVTVVLCAKFQSNWTTELDVMNKLNFMRFALKMSF